ncbi:hypothetical protein H206_02791 [Candidatus Electrothrix aarhusensis]|uniref:Uncharacterized protein n=1 Tax=Candidatus Electrothrix aarhusensis TaxID=1859131 RepID=A0A444IWI4_9BACT|nr:hypothetical protein H206_02791 [Candidatus Electrothrix aarhusensis]
MGRTNGLAEMAVTTGTATQATSCLLVFSIALIFLWIIMGNGQGFVLDQLLGKGLPLFSFQNRGQILCCPLSRTQGIGSQTRTLNIAYSKNFFITGPTSIIGFNPGTTSNIDYLDAPWQEADSAHHQWR